MNLTERDRKILIFLIPVVVLAAYWFLVLSPKREEATKLGDDLAKVEAARDKAIGEANAAEQAKSDFSKDLATIVRVGKAVPTTVDMPSLIVQLNKAAKGTDIRFERIKTGDRTEATTASTSGTPSSSGNSTAGTPAASGGAAAQSGPGQAAEQANGASDTADARNGTTGGASGSAGGTSPVAGLDTVPLEFTFSGSFFNLTDLFHQMKRFVRLSNQRLQVKGRLMSIDGFTLASDEFPSIKAEMKATVYLSPRTEGATAGATPAGPAAPGAPQAASSGSSTPAPPAATATGGAR